jgi:hypothetical protein
MVQGVALNAVTDFRLENANKVIKGSDEFHSNFKRREAVKNASVSFREIAHSSDPLHTEHKSPTQGLPDGIFSKIPIWVNCEGSCNGRCWYIK